MSAPCHSPVSYGLFGLSNSRYREDAPSPNSGGHATGRQGYVHGGMGRAQELNPAATRTPSPAFYLFLVLIHRHSITLATSPSPSSISTAPPLPTQPYTSNITNTASPAASLKLSKRKASNDLLVRPEKQAASMVSSPGLYPTNWKDSSLTASGV